VAVVENSAALPAVLPGGSTEGHRGWSCERRRDAQGEFYPWIVKSTGVTSSTSTLSAPTFGQFPAAEPRCDGPVRARGRAVTVLFPNAHQQPPVRPQHNEGGQLALGVCRWPGQLRHRLA
jgi:hypothetical protein